jgi:hypothetical protein
MSRKLVLVFKNIVNTTWTLDSVLKGSHKSTSPLAIELGDRVIYIHSDLIQTGGILKHDFEIKGHGIKRSTQGLEQTGIILAEMIKSHTEVTVCTLSTGLIEQLRVLENLNETEKNKISMHIYEPVRLDLRSWKTRILDLGDETCKDKMPYFFESSGTILKMLKAGIWYDNLRSEHLFSEIEKYKKGGIPFKIYRSTTNEQLDPNDLHYLEEADKQAYGIL